MILVTGAAGFIGRRLVQHLVRQGEAVRALVHSPRGERALRAAVPGAAAPEIVVGDVLDPASLRAAVDGCHLVFHLAGGYRGHPDDLWAVHRQGTANLVGALDGSTRVVLLSSTSVYGWERDWPADERTPPHPASAYGHAKLAAECLVLGLPDDRGAVVRSTIVYGPGDERGMLPRAHRLLSRGVRVLPGSGRNRIHLTHVDDLVEALLRAGRKGTGTYQVAGPEAAPVADILGALARGAGVAPPRFVGAAGATRAAARTVERCWQVLGLATSPPLTGHAVDVLTRDRAFAADRARRELGWRPAVALHDGLEETGRWLAGSRRGDVPDGAAGGFEPTRAAGDRGPPWRGYFEDPDEGLGTVYERFVLARIIDRALHLTGSDSLLHLPLFGMTGIPGLDAVFAARRGVRVGLADTAPQRLERVADLWSGLGLSPATHPLDRDPAGWPGGLETPYDLAFSFAALWWFDDPWKVLEAQARYARRGVLVAVPNRTVFLRLRRRTWHRSMFSRLNLDALDPGRIVMAGRSLGLEPVDSGCFDLPPFPDTAVPLARLLRSGPSEGARWSWSVLPHLRGDDPDLPTRIRWVGWLERRAPEAVAQHLAHHRYILLAPASQRRAAVAAAS